MPHHTSEETAMTKKEGIEIDVVEEFERITEIVGKVREAIMTIKGSDIKIKEWHFAVDKVEKEYNVDFTLKLTVTPKEE